SEMATANTRQACLDILSECGYQINFDDDDVLLEHAQKQTLDTFKNLCEDTALTCCVKSINQLNENNVNYIFSTLASQIPLIKTKSIRDYFKTWIDMYNVRNFYKGSRVLLPGGNLNTNELDIFPNAKPEEREDAIQKKLDTLAEIDKDDIFKPNPLFWWYLQREKELVIIKAILISKRFNYDFTWLRENLRGLYEQFQ
ncbi:MAG: hypothetical protein MJ054_01305, partial [Clostridia bacterium]|nr:hypothetical protein [Clostridia bacterium]